MRPWRAPRNSIHEAIALGAREHWSTPSGCTIFKILLVAARALLDNPFGAIFSLWPGGGVLCLGDMVVRQVRDFNSLDAIVMPRNDTVSFRHLLGCEHWIVESRGTRTEGTLLPAPVAHTHCVLLAKFRKHVISQFLAFIFSELPRAQSHRPARARYRLKHERK